MLVSLVDKFIFIEVPKTGSSSLTDALGGRVLHHPMRHVSAVWVRRHLGEQWNEYETYAIIRQPVDWLMSWYRFLLNSEKEGRPRCAPIGDKSFHDFVVDGCNEGPHANTLRLQKSYISDPVTDRVLINNIIPFDHLDIGLQIFAQRFGIKDFSIPHLNRTYDSSGEIEVTAETKQIVEKNWLADFNVYNNVMAQSLYLMLSEIKENK